MVVGGNSSTSDVGISVATSGIGETGDLDRFGGQLTLSKARAQVLCDRLAVYVFLRMVPVAPGRVASAPAPPAVTRLARPWGSEPTENQTIPAGPVETAPAYQDPEKEVFRCRPCESPSETQPNTKYCHRDTKAAIRKTYVCKTWHLMAFLLPFVKSEDQFA